MKHIARCSVGRNRWYWCVWQDDDIYAGLPPVDSGYAATSQEAEMAAKEKSPDCDQYPASFALHAHQRKVKANRKPNPDAKGATSVEFLYTDHCSDYDGSEWSTAHPIMKKTAKCVFVLDSNGRTRRFDRAKLETEGDIMGRGWWEVFYTTPIEQRRGSRQPDWAEVLGVDCKDGKAEIEKAYRRRALETHPDRGGDPEDFKAVQVAWEMAQNILA